MKEEALLRQRLEKGKISLDEALLYLAQIKEFKDTEFVTVKVRVKRSTLSTIKMPLEEVDLLPSLLSLLLESAGYSVSPEKLSTVQIPSKVEFTMDEQGTKIVVEMDG